MTDHSQATASGATPAVVETRVLHIPTNIPLPAKLDTNGNLSNNWKRFKRNWENYELATRLKDPVNPDQNKQLRAATLLTCIGSEALDIFDSLDFDNEDQRKDIDVVVEKLEKHCVGKTNETYERYVFNQRTQEPNESVDSYVTALKTLAKTCSFGTLEESLVRDNIVIGIRDTAARKRLLEKSTLTLKDCIDICKSFETTKLQLKTIDNDEVNAVGRRVQSRTRQKEPPKQKESVKCLFCGRNHEKDRRKCPAWGQTCRSCGKQNHFAHVCQNTGNPPRRGTGSPHRQRGVNALEEDESEEEYIAYMEITEDILKVDIANKLTATMLLNDKEEEMCLDNGATVNVLSERTYKRVYGVDSLKNLDRTDITLVMYNKVTEKPLGRKRVRIVNPKNGKKYSVEFVVVRGNTRSILGARASQQMRLLTVNPDNIQVVDTSCHGAYQPLSREQVLAEYSDVFKGEGCLEGPLHLEIDPKVPPTQLPTRKVPIAVKDQLKEEIDRLTNLGIIAPVDVPTEWISALVVTSKKNGKIRLCIDPKLLNQALKRNHYPLPTIDDILPELSQARCFSVLDAKNGFWQVQLDEQSSFLTTFGTPWGRYRWVRMPFGVSPAPEEFQRRMDLTLEGLPGSKAIADDILVFGCGSTDEEADKDHDQKLKALLDRCRAKGLTLNETKMQLRQKQVAFMGHLVTDAGLQADPEKVRAITDMPAPTDKQGIQRLLGMINYVQKFAPNLSDVTKPLRDLIKSDSEFLWEERVHGKALNEAKRILSEAPILQYFNPKVQPVLQCDASMNGLGACLMQDGHPIAYASRALTTTECNYAQIEKEMLAIVFGMEKFDTFVYGRQTLVESDHKPLETILKKGLHNAPKRLQRMMLRLQRYDFHVVYKKGTLMYMADTLSRAFLHETPTTYLEQVMTVAERSPTEIAVEHIDMCQNLPIRAETLMKIQKHTQQDEQLQVVAEVILKGWPEAAKKVKEEAQEFFPFRESLTMQNGIIFKGERVVIPHGLREEIKTKLHSSHLGIQGCLRRAREAFYWPKMNTEIEEYISKCHICNSFQSEQQKEPMVGHPVPNRPWEVIASDLFELDGKHYLVTVDYYSNFAEVDRLYSTTSRDVITKLKSHLSRHGIPDRVFTDNGPQYSSGEFEKFAQDYQFSHITSSPNYPQSNGKAENAVKTVKSIMRKAHEAKQDPYLALLDFRNTPTEGLQTSPAQRLFGRRTKTLLPLTTKLLESPGWQDTVNKLKDRKERQEQYYNHGTKELEPLHTGDVVRIKPSKAGEKRWAKATVQDQVNVRSYKVTTDQGQSLRRNRRHLRRTRESAPAALPPEYINPEEADTPHQQCTTHTSDSSTTEVDAAPLPTPPSNAPRPEEQQQGSEPQALTTRCSSRGRILRRPAHLADYV